MFWNGIDLHWAYAILLPSITKKTQCSHRAKDILHDGLLRFALTGNQNRHQQPHAYLRTIVQHLIIEQYRKESYFNLYQRAQETTEHTSPSPEYLADIQQRLQILLQIIQDLPPRCREVFIMYRIEGISQKEIALQCNISLNMVERHIIRALLDIRAARQLLITS